MQTWSNDEGRIRLSEDDGPPAREFLEDDYDDDNEGLADDEPLALRAERLRAAASPVPPLIANNSSEPLEAAIEGGSDGSVSPSHVHHGSS